MPNIYLLSHNTTLPLIILYNKHNTSHHLLITGAAPSSSSSLGSHPLNAAATSSSSSSLHRGGDAGGMGGIDSPMGGAGDFFYQGESEGDYSYASYGHHGGAYNVEESSLHTPAAINFNGWDWRIFQSLIQAKVSTFLAGGRGEDDEFEFDNDLPDVCDVEHTGTGTGSGSTWRDYSNNNANGGNSQPHAYGKQHSASSSAYNSRARGGNINNLGGSRNGHDYMGGRSGSFDSNNDDEIDPYTLSASLTPSFDPMVCDQPVMTSNHTSSSGSGGGGSGGGGGSLGDVSTGGGHVNTSTMGMKHHVDGSSAGGSVSGGASSGGASSGGAGGGAGGSSTWNRSNGGRGTKRAGDTTLPTTTTSTSIGSTSIGSSTMMSSSSSVGGGSHNATISSSSTTAATPRVRGERRRMVADCKALRAQITSFEADWTKTHGTVLPLYYLTLSSLYYLTLSSLY